MAEHLGLNEVGASVNQFREPFLQLAKTDVVDLERQPEVGRDLCGLVRQAGVRHLAQVQQRLVVAEQHLLELRVPVEAEAAHDRALEVANQPRRSTMSFTSLPRAPQMTKAVVIPRAPGLGSGGPRRMRR